ncbi:MAG: class I SAM-dependent methyltransferase [bacterium]|nr:class I SAM-dependent methyltransferase [bacterium]
MLDNMNTFLNTNFNIQFTARIGNPRNLPENIGTKIICGEISKHFVPTPTSVIDKMINELGKVSPTDRILEPSAGYGHIADRLQQKTHVSPKNIAVVEPVDEFRTVLQNKGYSLVGTDIMQLTSKKGNYDKVIMNPPFDNGLDIMHLLRCFNLLKKGGTLVAVLPKNAFIKPKSKGYEKWVKDWLNNGEQKEINEYLFDLLERYKSRVIKCGKAFKNSDVPDDVSTRIVVINK